MAVMRMSTSVLELVGFLSRSLYICLSSWPETSQQWNQDVETKKYPAKLDSTRDEDWLEEMNMTRAEYLKIWLAPGPPF